MNTDSPILITGIPRSGATAIGATINICGAFGGDMSKRGMYSNDKIRELTQLYLKLNQEHIPINWKTEIENILVGEGYKEGVWMYKDSGICQMWKVWQYAYPNAKYVIVRRRTSDIIQSCMKTGYMTEHTDEAGWASMVHQYESKFVEMIQEGLNCKVIWPERMTHGDYQQVYELCDWLGLKWNRKALNFIDTLLWGKPKERSK